jgi:hypothetical protein
MANNNGINPQVLSVLQSMMAPQQQRQENNIWTVLGQLGNAFAAKQLGQLGNEAPAPQTDTSNQQRAIQFNDGIQTPDTFFPQNSNQQAKPAIPQYNQTSPDDSIMVQRAKNNAAGYTFNPDDYSILNLFSRYGGGR